MTSVIRLLVVVVVAGVAAYALTRILAPQSESPASELAWLSTEFELTADQAAQIEALQDAYRPICDQHCADVIAARKSLASADSPAARAEAKDRLDALQRICHESTSAHLRDVAAVMDPTQGRRYLAMIAPRLSDHGHAEPFGLK